MMNITKFASFGEDLADLVRPLLINAYQMGAGYEKKEDGSVVTAVDRDVEKLIRSQIINALTSRGIY